MEAQNTMNTENNLKKEEQNQRKPIMFFKEIEKSILKFITGETEFLKQS